MNNARLLIILALVGLVIAGTPTSAQQMFPMSKGATWTYSARVKWDKNGAQPGGVRTLTWTSTIVDSYSKDDLSMALLHGGPWDLAFYSPGKKPSDYAIVRDGDTYYFIPSGAQLIFNEIKAGKTTDLASSLAGDIWFRVPMEISDDFCAPGMEENAPFNCWSVEKITQTHSLRIPGFRLKSATEYFLALLTNPDTTTMTLVPGLGIVTWEYEHHGTISEAAVKLVSLHAGTPAPRVVRRKPGIQTRKVK
ncbi:MAG: hypothetical protein ACRD3E_18920 [Terriglobales bacterium]